MTTTINASTSSGLVVTPDNSGNVLLQYNGVAAPAFSAYRTSTQSIVANTWAKIAFNAENFDTNNNFDTSTSRFTPTVPGYYQINLGWVNTNSSSYVYCQIYKNGTGYNYMNLTGSAGAGAGVSTLIYMNGTTDYLEGWYYSDTGAVANNNGSWFTGCLLRGA